MEKGIVGAARQMRGYLPDQGPGDNTGEHDINNKEDQPMIEVLFYKLATFTAHWMMVISLKFLGAFIFYGRSGTGNDNQALFWNCPSMVWYILTRTVAGTIFGDTAN